MFVKNPIVRLPIAHSILDPHFSSYIVESYASKNSYSAVNICITGLYHWMYAVGFTNIYDIYSLVVALELLAIICLALGHLHMIRTSLFIQWSSTIIPVVTEKSLTSSLHLGRSSSNMQPIHMNPSTTLVALYDGLAISSIHSWSTIILGAISLGWALHCSALINPDNSVTTTEAQLALYNGAWSQYLSSSYTFIGGLRLDTASIELTDIAHHHLALGTLLLWQHALSSSLYKALGPIHWYRYSPLAIRRQQMSSLHLQLALSLVLASSLVTGVSVGLTNISPYPYVAYDFITCMMVDIHHSSIAITLMIGSYAHGGISLVRDVIDKHRGVTSYSSGKCPVTRLLDHKSSIISHLSWVVGWLSFHTLGIYVHNDTIIALGSSSKALLIEPLAAQLIQEYSGKELYGSRIAYPDVILDTINKSTGAYLFGPSLNGDLLVAHATSLGLHLTTLILMKGALDARRSRLMPDKMHVGYHFACDGPARSGTCDISAWDSVYLAIFWSLNTGAWSSFYIHWKHITLWQNATFQFDEGAYYLNAWFRDYLWFNSSSLISGYDATGVNDVAIWAWIFLAAHLTWATGFMFLISWRGYWQELVDIILYMHLKTPFLYDIFSSSIYTPVALSIIQARFIGVIHFTVGFVVTYAAFILGATS